MTSEYFRTRRRRMKRKKICTRCGTDKAQAGHVHCSACLSVMVVKRSRTDLADAKLLRLKNRLKMIEEAHRTVLGEIARVR